MDDKHLTRRQFLQAGLGVLATAALPAPSLSSALTQTREDTEPALSTTQPNVVYIFADQLRACSVGCYGNDEISTPHLDQLVVKGARFANAVSTSPLCSPHRACLMTGRYPNVTGVVANNIKLPQEEVGVAQVFSHRGYTTQYIGKWHLDGLTPDPLVDPGWVEPRDRQGFRRWLAFNRGHVYYEGKYYLNWDPTLRTIPDGMYEPDFQTTRAIQFIANNAADPFCLFLSIGIPHPPTGGVEYLPPGGDYVFPYDPDALTLRPNVDYPDEPFIRQRYADYYGMISNFDWNVGRIVDALDRFDLTNNTIVVVSSDHGDVLGSHYGELDMPSGKGVIYAESMDVPFILRYPTAVDSQVVSNVFTSVDIMPTLLGLCGLPVPRGVMGRDFSPLLTVGGKPVEPPYGPVPSTDSALVGMFSALWAGVRTPQYSLECEFGPLFPRRLFDNTLDPYQMTNLVDDPDCQEVKDALYADLLAWLEYVAYEPG